MSGTLRHALYLAWRALAAGPGRAIVLVFGVALALFLPLFTAMTAERVERSLLVRAEATPILLGHEGNEFDLTMSALYFRGQVGDDIPFGRSREVARRGYGLAVPLHLKFSAQGVPIVGTSVDYLGARGLEVEKGRRMALLGELVAGARVAEEFGLEPGAKLRSDLTNLYNLAGAYPKVLDVVGVLAPSGGPDDDVFFVDMRTAWMLEGVLHGHEEVTPEMTLDPEAAAEDETANLEATAAIFIFSEVDDTNRESFHLHGREDDAPLSAVLVFPEDQRAHDQLLGDYALEETLQAVRPVEVVRTVLSIVVRAREALGLVFAAVGLSTAAMVALVMTLSFRLRRDELVLMRRLGASRAVVATMFAAELALIVAGGALVAALLALVSSRLLAALLGA